MENMSRPVSGSSASSVGGGVVRFLNPMSTSFVDRHRSKRTYSTATEIIIARLFDAKDKIQVKRNLVFTRCDSTRSVMVGNMFNPHHKIYQTCMFTLETLGIIHALYTSYDMSFVTNRERLWLLVIDCILDAAFMFESYIQTRTAKYVQASDVLVADINEAWRIFWHSKAAVRAAHTMPLQLCHWIATPRFMDYRSARPIKMLRALKLLRLKPVFNLNERETVKNMRSYNLKSFVALIIIRFFIVAHVIACVVYGITFMDNHHGGPSWIETLCYMWNMPKGCESNHTALWLYLICMYYAMMCITTVGFGNVMPYSPVEIVAHICGVCLGACHNAVMMSSVMSALNEYQYQHQKYRRALGTMEQFMNTHDISKNLSREMKVHFDYQWARTHCIDEDEFMRKCLSPQLHARLLEELYLPPMRKCLIFQNVPPHITMRIMMGSSPMFVRKDEIVFRPGEYADAMFVVIKGMLKSRTRKYTPGSYFGETSILPDTHDYSFTVTAEAHSDLLRIPVSVIKEYLADFQEIAENMIRVATRTEKLRKADEYIFE